MSKSVAKMSKKMSLTEAENVPELTPEELDLLLEPFDYSIAKWQEHRGYALPSIAQ